MIPLRHSLIIQAGTPGNGIQAVSLSHSVGPGRFFYWRTSLGSRLRLTATGFLMAGTATRQPHYQDEAAGKGNGYQPVCWPNANRFSLPWTQIRKTVSPHFDDYDSQYNDNQHAPAYHIHVFVQLVLHGFSAPGHQSCHEKKAPATTDDRGQHKRQEAH